MTAIRSFIAIDLNAHVQNLLGEVINQLKPLTGNTVRWVPENNIHITLKFLGDTSPTNLEILKKIISVEANRVQPFELTVDGLGAFPSIRRPRVIWVGIQAPPALFALQRSIDTETQRLGYTPEDRPFSPHLTLGRLAHNASPEEIRHAGEILAASNISVQSTFKVKTVVLFRSDLQPGGAVYTPIHIAPFK
jgi:2'-5' RNA ligase